MARSSWRVWTESLTGGLIGMPITFSAESQALAHAVKLYRDGDSGQTVRTFVVCDTGVQLANKRRYELPKFPGDTGQHREKSSKELYAIEKAQKEAHRGSIKGNSDEGNL